MAGLMIIRGVWGMKYVKVCSKDDKGNLCPHEKWGQRLPLKVLVTVIL
jgi:hypothetical protein